MLPINILINGSISYQPNAAQPQNTSTGLIVGPSNVIDLATRIRTYQDSASVVADFGPTAPEALGAVAYFSQLPQPSTLLVGRWAKTAASGQLVGAALTSDQAAIAAWQAITTGSVAFTIDGSLRALASLNFSGVFNLNGVAAVIDTALSTYADCYYNASFNRFEIRSSTTGTSSTVSFATPTGSGTDVSARLAMTATSSGAYIAQGAPAESALAAVQAIDAIAGPRFYGVSVLSTTTDAEHLPIAQYLQSTASLHSYWITSSASAMLTANDTTSILYQCRVAGLSRTFVQYSSTSLVAAISAMAKAINIDYSGVSTASTLMYKTEPGVTAEALNASQLAALTAGYGNAFVQYNNNTAILQFGTMTNGQFADTIVGVDAFYVEMQTALFNALYTSPTKIPQTDAGTSVLTTAVTNVCRQFERAGFLAPGTWTNAGFGSLTQDDFMPSGYYVYAPPVASQSQAARAARRSVTIQVAAKLAGAVHTVQFGIVVNL